MAETWPVPLDRRDGEHVTSQSLLTRQPQADWGQQSSLFEHGLSPGIHYGEHPNLLAPTIRCFSNERNTLSARAAFRRPTRGKASQMSLR
jgi:hypothetical protein